jgi:hypothetical protein
VTWYEETLDDHLFSRHDRAVESRLSLIWVGLLGVIESIDILTTAVDRARGSIESAPLSATVLDQGGLVLFVTVKVGLVAAAAIAALLALRWLRFKRDHARTLYLYVLSAIRMATVALAIACLNNALLLKSLS